MMGGMVDEPGGRRHTLTRGDVRLVVDERGAPDAPPLVLLHGLAGSAREMLPTAEVLADRFRVLVPDQRGHGLSTRRPAEVSRRAFVDDVAAVLEALAPGERAVLVGQSMGAHTAFLTAAWRPELVASLVMLEGHVQGETSDAAARGIGRFFASWPQPFADAAAARAALGDGPLERAWVADLELGDGGLRARFDADVMEATIRAVHEPRWAEWESLTVPTLAVFAREGLFSAEDRDELIRRRPATTRVDLPDGSHDAHLDAADSWHRALREHLPR